MDRSCCRRRRTDSLARLSLSLVLSPSAFRHLYRVRAPLPDLEKKRSLSTLLFFSFMRKNTATEAPRSDLSSPAGSLSAADAAAFRASMATGAVGDRKSSLDGSTREGSSLENEASTTNAAAAAVAGAAAALENLDGSAATRGGDRGGEGSNNSYDISGDVNDEEAASASVSSSVRRKRLSPSSGAGGGGAAGGGGGEGSNGANSLILRRLSGSFGSRRSGEQLRGSVGSGGGGGRTDIGGGEEGEGGDVGGKDAGGPRGVRWLDDASGGSLAAVREFEASDDGGDGGSVGDYGGNRGVRAVCCSLM